MKAIGYARVSTQEQAGQGVSLQDQEARIRKYAEAFGIDIIEVIVDPGCSAKDLNRKGAQRVLEMMKTKKIEMVIVSKLDRLTRSIRDLADIIELTNKSDISLVSLAERIDTGSAAGRMFVNIMGVLSQWERETIAERTRCALQYKKLNRQVYNGIPLFGYRNDKDRLVPVISVRTIRSGGRVGDLRVQPNS